MRQFIENRLGLTLIAACALGLAFPFGDHLPDGIIVALLAVVTFLSCYKITLMSDLFSWRPLVFCVGRYAVLPLVLWYAADLLIPDFALAVFLIALLPAGVSSPAFTGLFGGNVALAVAVTVASSVMSLALIPLYIPLIAPVSVAIDSAPLLGTLAWCIVLPACAYAVLRRRKRIRQFSLSHGRFVSVLLIACIMAIVISKERLVILQDPAALLAPMLVALGCYVIFVLAGVCLKTTRANRVTYGVCSSFNNAALGVSLALLHFDSRVVLTAIAAELAWALLPFMIRPFAGQD